MESLYTKYRPQTFADVVGQTHVVTTLEHAVLEGRTSHAYLFCGPRGTGKTTMARLLAKALMCEQGEGHLPDGSCEQCRLIAAGEHPDVYELDAASRTGVDNVREEIISRVNFAPVRGRYKMYIIDEVHMLTTAAFNALLKTLEEPPSHVVFVLCTTDPQKIPETILSRVQRFDFHSISNADIQGRLAYICEREGFAYDPEALELVVRHARGGMRDAISELEQLSVSGGGTISVDVARDVLGEVSASTLERMSLAMANRDVPTLFAQVEGLVEVGRDLLQFTRALAARLRDVYVVAAIGAKSASVSAADTDLPAISREAQAFGSVDRVARALQLLSDASTEMRVAPNQRLVLEVALTKIARPQTELTLEALADRVASLERQVAALSSPAARREQAPAATTSAPPARQAEKAAKNPPEPPAQRQQAQPSAAPSKTPVTVTQAPADASRAHAAPTQAPVPQGEPRQAPQAPVSRPAPSQQPPVQAAPPAYRSQPQTPQQSQMGAASAAPVSAPKPQSAPAPQQTPSAPAGIQDAGELQRRWKQVVDSLLAAHPQHGSLLLHATLASDDGRQLLVSLPKGSGFACKMLDRPDVRSHVDPVIAQVFGPRKTHFAEADVIATIQARDGAASVAAPAPAPSAATSHSAQAAATPSRTQTPVSQQPQAVANVASGRSAASDPTPKPVQNPVPQAAATAQPSQAQAPQQVRRASQTPVQTAGNGGMPQNQAQAAPVKQHTPAAPASASWQSAPASPAPSYPAPWEPISYDDDQVPYDDMDVAPYEEDFLFGTVDPAQLARPTRQASYASAAPAWGAPAQQAPASFADVQPSQSQVSAPSTPASVPAQVSAPSVIPWMGDGMQRSAATPQAERQPEQKTAPKVEAAPKLEPVAPEPEVRSNMQAEAPASEPEPMPVTLGQPVQQQVQNPDVAAEQSVPEPAASPALDEQPAPEPESSPAAEPPAQPKPKAKRASRQTGGVPNDILAMLSDVFGEGITFTELSPDDEVPTEDVVEDLVPDADFDEADGFADEPVDDADYEEDDE